MPAGTRWSAAVASLQHGIDALQETMKTSQQQQQENLAEPWRISLQDGDMSCETVGLAGSIICFFFGSVLFWQRTLYWGKLCLRMEPAVFGS
jgi:hypothetical protein